ncbi:MAG: choice-of-anchor D domain-containing protein [Solirubrobacterales bacterium]|nr:choice-of-anchor D domain-containing protein [Solirubrobacterales bacterium]
MGVSDQTRGARQGSAPSANTTGTVPVGRYVLDFHGPAGSTVWPVRAPKADEPPEELVVALEVPSDEAERRDRGVAGRLDALIDRAADVTDKIERPTVILRSVIEGRMPPAEVLPNELADLLGWLRALVRAGRLGDAIRLGRPLCRLLGLTLRWAAMVEGLRLVLDAALALADTGTEAWAEHELGTLHLVIDDPDRARELLARARKLREEIDDEQGLAATDHNRGLLPRARRIPSFTSTLLGLGALVFIVFLLALANSVGSGSSSPQPSPMPATQAASAAAGGAVASPSRVDFGTEALGRSTPAQSVTLLAPHAAVTVASVRIEGPDASDFTLVSDSCTGRRVAPGGTCRVAVSFAPRVIGRLEATLRFGDRTPAGDQHVSLSGTATRSLQILVNPAELSFGTLAVGHQSPTETVQLANQGASAITVATVEMTGADPADFAVRSNDCTGASVPAGGKCTVAVTFTPSAAGQRTATLTLASNAGAGAQQVSLAGAGGRAGGLSITPGTLDFGSVGVGQTSAVQTTTLSNASNTSAPVGAITLEGAGQNDFAIASNGCSRAIPANGSCTVGVRFAPTTGGPLTAVLAIADTATGQTRAVALRGTGATSVAAAVAPQQLSFGEEPYGQTSAGQAVSVSNQGSAPLTVQGATVGGSDAGDFEVTADQCGGKTVAPGQSCTVTVTFTPKAVGQRTATLVISDNATRQTQSVAISGAGTGSPTATATPSFAVVVQSGLTVRAPTVTLTNGGNARLSISSAQLTGPGAGAYGLSPDNCSGHTVDPGFACTVTIVFTTTTPGGYFAILRFTDNAGSSPQTVPVEGKYTK